MQVVRITRGGVMVVLGIALVALNSHRTGGLLAGAAYLVCALALLGWEIVRGGSTDRRNRERDERELAAYSESLNRLTN